MKFIVDSFHEGIVSLRVPGTNYRNSFKMNGGAAAAVGKRIAGTIHAPARKVEAVSDGGNYVEPIYGRPRRMQGTVQSVDSANHSLTVQVGYPVAVRLPQEQQAADFPVGSRVGWDNADLPLFEPSAK